ncbi:hypothetical protein [Noviherbaspirillum galbum]|uniref:Uncharacterized protein n=1 Tax=Noviherbaspirillum galbum TaxID=2709383 RepID=A0A6B3SKB1_9BURK|nr:hypothetical protein [Noviherbaspirillum galbum]NEX61197.1 hypothetical protein [Noviherbaspirillum galbum]
MTNPISQSTTVAVGLTPAVDTPDGGGGESSAVKHSMNEGIFGAGSRDVPDRMARTAQANGTAPIFKQNLAGSGSQESVVARFLKASPADFDGIAMQVFNELKDPRNEPDGERLMQAMLPPSGHADRGALFEKARADKMLGPAMTRAYSSLADKLCDAKVISNGLASHLKSNMENLFLPRSYLH